MAAGRAGSSPSWPEYLGRLAPRLISKAEEALDALDGRIIGELLCMSEELRQTLQDAEAESIVGLALIEAALRISWRELIEHMAKRLREAGRVEADLEEYRRRKEELTRRLEAVLGMIREEAPRYGLRRSRFEIWAADNLATAMRLEDLKRAELGKATAADRVLAFVKGLEHSSAWARVVLSALSGKKGKPPYKLFELTPGVAGNEFGVSAPRLDWIEKLIRATLTDYAARGFRRLTIEREEDGFKIEVEKDGERLAARTSAARSRRGEIVVARLKGGAVRALAVDDHIPEADSDAPRRYFRGLGGWLASDIAFTRRPRVDTTSYVQSEIFRAMGFTMWARDVANITEDGIKPYYSGDAVRDSPMEAYLGYLKRRIKELQDKGLPRADEIKSIVLEKLNAYKGKARGGMRHLANLEFAVLQMLNGVIAGEVDGRRTAVCIHSCRGRSLTLPMIGLDRHWSYARAVYPLLDVIDMTSVEYAYHFTNYLLGDGYVRRYDATIVVGDFRSVGVKLPLNAYHRAALHIISLATHGVDILRIRFNERRGRGGRPSSIEIAVKIESIRRYLEVAWGMYYGVVYQGARRIYERMGTKEALKDHLFQKMRTLEYVLSQSGKSF